MKKSLFFVLFFAFNYVNCVETSDDVDVETVDTNPQKTTNRNFLLNFDNLKELSENNALSDFLKKLLDNCLTIVRQLTNNNEASGNEEEIQSAQGYLAQLITLKNRITNSASTDKINQIQEIDEKGKNEINENQKIVEQIKAANSTHKIAELPGINKDVVERIKSYNQLISKIEQAKTLDDLKAIPHMSEKVIDDIKKYLDALEAIEKIEKVDDLKQNATINAKLITEIQQLENLKEYVEKHTSSINDALEIPGLNEQTKVEIARLQRNFEVEKEQNQKLQQKLLKASQSVEQITAIARNEYHFRMIVISLLLKIKFGFEFVHADNFDASETEYDHSVISHAMSWWPYSGGLKRSAWRDASSHLGEMLQIALSVENITEHLDILKNHLSKITKQLQSMNDIKSKFILDSLSQLSNVLNRFNKNQDSMDFDDFNSRKRMILERIEKEKQELNFRKQAKIDHDASKSKVATAKDKNAKSKKTTDKSTKAKAVTTKNEKQKTVESVNKTVKAKQTTTKNEKPKAKEQTTKKK